MPETISDKVAHVLTSSQTRNHTCHWPNCTTQVPPAMWGCKTHWFSLPKNIRHKIWSTYKSGQEITQTPTPEYIAAAREAQDWIKSR